MTIHLPQELERYIHDQVVRGEFASADEALTEAVRLLQQRGPDQVPMTEARGTADRATRQREGLDRLCRRLDSMPIAPADDDGLSNRDHDRILYGK
jgi:Arc/MetJ-type ribon-helix-helix transcriptional regulator